MSVAVKEMNDYLVNDVNRKVKREPYLMTLKEVGKVVRGTNRDVYEALRYSVSFTEKIACVRMSITRLVKESGVSRATVYRCLNFLEEKGLVRREKEEGSYCNTFWVSQELGLLNKIKDKEEFNYKQPHEPAYQLSSCSFDRSVFGVQSSSNTFETSLTNDQTFQPMRYRSLVLSIEKKEKNIIKKEKEYLVSGDEKKDLNEKPVDEKTKESEIKADKQTMSLNSGNEKNIRSDYYNNSDQGQKKESKSLENKNNSVKSDYFDNRAKDKQSVKLKKKYNNIKTEIQPYIDIYHELCVPLGCPKVEDDPQSRRRVFSAIKNLQKFIEQNGWPELTPESFRAFLQESIKNRWFLICTYRQELAVLLKPRHYDNQRKKIITAIAERKEKERLIREQEKRIAESEKNNALKQQKRFEKIKNKYGHNAHQEETKRLRNEEKPSPKYSDTCKSHLHEIKKLLAGRSSYEIRTP